MMHTLNAKLGQAVPTKLPELAAPGRTLKKQAAGILAYFDRPGTFNAPTETANERFKNPPGSALGSWTLTSYITRPCWNPKDSGPHYTPFVKSP